VDYGFTPLGNKPLPPHRVKDPPQSNVDLPDPLDMRPGPSPVLRVRRYGPCLALRGPWSGGPAAVHPASVSVSDYRVLAGRPLTSFC
jgi:hypothetical protein